MPLDQQMLEIFKPILDPWYDSLKNPLETQNRTLLDLLKLYKRTQLGQRSNADEVESVRSFQSNFPVLNYKTLNPYLAEIQEGNYKIILPEPMLCWVMTRGSTGPAKVLPVTRTHIEQILSCGSRAFLNHAIRAGDRELLTGKILNLNFPSSVHATTVNGRPVTYGYSSGTYARLNPALGEARLIPRQEDIDALGPGITMQDWEKRFELAYQQGSAQNIVATMGVTPVVVAFAKYISRRHGRKPRDLWRFRALFCTSVRKIQSKYAPILKKYFGPVPIVEIYSATEGVFAQQIDELPYVTPNYDKYFFEVKTGQGFRMLHELKRGEWGKLIVSSCLFPRYDIGDLIKSAGNNYFRVIGRHKITTLIEHRLYKFFLGL